MLCDLFLFSRCNIFRCQEKVLVTWQITWPSRWMTLTPSQCQSRASHRQNVGRTCTSCSTSTLSSPIPLESWRKAHQRTASQVGLSFSSQPASNSYRLSHPCISFLLYLTFNTILPLIISLWYCCTFLISHLHSAHPCKPCIFIIFWQLYCWYLFFYNQFIYLEPH